MTLIEKEIIIIKLKKISLGTIWFPKNLDSHRILGENGLNCLAFLQTWDCFPNLVKIKFWLFPPQLQCYLTCLCQFTYIHLRVCYWRIWVLKFSLFKISPSFTVEPTNTSAKKVQYNKHCLSSYVWNFEPLLYYFFQNNI